MSSNFDDALIYSQMFQKLNDDTPKQKRQTKAGRNGKKETDGEHDRGPRERRQRQEVVHNGYSED